MGFLDTLKLTLSTWRLAARSIAVVHKADESDGGAVPISSDHPLPVVVIGGDLGGGGGGGADTSGLARETTLEAVRDRLIDLFPLLANTDGLEGLLSALATRTETQPVSLASVPLATGAATEATLAAVNATLKAQLDIASSVWTDNSGTYFVRRDLVNEGAGTVSVQFTDPSGAAATPGAGLRPLASTTRVAFEAVFDATANGTGFSAGDALARVVLYNPDTQASTAIWYNLITSATLTAAPAANAVQRADEAVTARLADANGVGFTVGKKTAALSFPVTLDSDQKALITPDNLPLMGNQVTLTIGTASGGMPVSTTSGTASYALIQVFTSVRFRLDATDATLTGPEHLLNGSLTNPGTLELTRPEDITGFRCIAASSAGTGSVQYRG